jgi:hypothetical protein
MNSSTEYQDIEIDTPSLTSNRQTENTEMFDFSQVPKTSKPSKNIPFGVRCIIYSYLDLMTLLNCITKLSRKERDTIPMS